MTSDQIVDRVRTVCAGPPFYLTEATSWATFDLTPDQAIDGSFRIPPPASQSIEGMFSYAEGRTDSLQIWVARKLGQNYDDTRRTLSRDMHSLTSAIVRDAHEQSGDYAVLTEGRGHAIAPDKRQANYVTLRLTLPITYETQL